MSSLRLCLVVVAIFSCPAFAREDEESDRIAKLIARLGSAKFDERKDAAAALDAVGRPALDALQLAAISNPDPEIRQRAGSLAAAIVGRYQPARDFATQVMKSVGIVHKNYAIEVNQGDLVAGLVRGMFAQLKEKLPPTLEARLKTASDLKEQDLGSLLADARIHLAAREGLGQKKDVYLALTALMEQLDPWSRFEQRDGVPCCQPWRVEWKRIGVDLRLAPATNLPQVVTPIKDGPAYRAGVRADDILEAITHLDDRGGKPLNPPRLVPTKGLTIEEVEEELLGPAGTRLRLQIRREGKAEPLEIELARGAAMRETVVGSRRLEDDSPDFWLDRQRKIGYARITDFTVKTPKALTKAVRDLESGGASGLVLDLRFNPGGLLMGAVDSADLFTDGDIVTFRSRGGSQNTFSAEADTIRPKLPIACLVNGESESASEILAGSLQDHQRAVIVGERTKGRGAVRNVLDIDEGQLFLTTTIFLRPSGKRIARLIIADEKDEWGVTPDQVLELTAKEQEELAEHLKQQTILGKRERPAYKDRQLELAVEVLRKRMATP